MDGQDKFDNFIVYKDRSVGEDRGILFPVLLQLESGDFKIVSKDKYPSGIYVSKDYNLIDSTYRSDELFLLKTHYFDEEKTEQDGIDRYWTKGDLATSLPQNTLVPIINMSLPPVSTGVLPDNALVPNKIFFIFEEHENKIYGPFTATSSETGDEKVVEPAGTPALSLGLDMLGVFERKKLVDCIFEISINGESKCFLSSLKDLEGRYYEKIDYTSDSKLIRYANKLQIGKNARFLAKREAEKLQQAIALFERQNQNFVRGNDKIERLKSVLDRYLNETNIGYQLVKDYFETSKGKVFLSDYVKFNEQALLSGKFNKIEEEVKRKESELQSKIEGIDRQLNKKQQELQDINKSIEEARLEAKEKIQQIEQEAEETRRERLKEKEEKLQGEIESLEKEKDRKKAELDETLGRIGIANDLEKMHNHNIYLQGAEEKLKNASRGFEEMMNNPESLAKKMGELSVVSQVLKGGSISQGSNPVFIPLEFSTSKLSSAADVVDAVKSYFDNDFGRSFSEIDMANLLISITQSFLTVLSGPPGVGKTSTIVRLAEALKLGGPTQHSNFLYMPVARGWVSGRDILGFYNSLNNTYQRARTGLYDFLNRPLQDNNNSLQCVLLDEANLSPMEHYWSDFIGMCDKEGRFRPIETGIPGNDLSRLVIQKNVRFIATINNDSTTEKLSPRLIDRVPVISLEHDTDSDLGGFSSGVPLDGALAYELFENYFISDEGELNAMHRNKLDKLLSILRERNSELGQPIAISHRKVSAIINYYSAATRDGLMGADIAFDFAISQYILPHIEGYGNKFRNRIAKIQSELGASYPRSSSHLERILASGNDFTGTYSFF